MMLTSLRALLIFSVLLLPLTPVGGNETTNPLSPFPGATEVEGRKLPFLTHRPVASLRVYVFHDGKPVPIPFQVDERDRRERWILDPGAKPSAGESLGEFDDSDVVVIMNRDLGARGAVATLPPGATVWGEIRLGPETQPLGFAYLGSFDHPPPLSESASPAARYEPETDRVYAERYALEFRAPLPRHVAFVNHLGEFGENTVAGVHVIGEVRFVGGLFTLRRTDSDIQSELLNYRNGPVRAIRRARYWIPLPFGFHTTGRVDLLFYRDFVEGSAQVKLKIPPSLILADGELQTYFDFLHFEGARLLLEGSTLDGLAPDYDTSGNQVLLGRPARWAALRLPDGRIVLFVVRLEGALRKLEQQVYFKDTVPEDSAGGGQPLFGFQFSRVSRLETGTHRLSAFAAVLDNVSLEDVATAARFFLSPPEVNVTELKQ
jgi:hypothetical protein